MMGERLALARPVTHYWFLVQPKPETPEEARIDELMDEIDGRAGLRARRRRYWEDRNHRERAGLVDLAADPRAEDPGQQPVRQRPAEHPARIEFSGTLTSDLP